MAYRKKLRPRKFTGQTPGTYTKGMTSEERRSQAVDNYQLRQKLKSIQQRNTGSLRSRLAQRAVSSAGRRRDDRGRFI